MKTLRYAAKGKTGPCNHFPLLNQLARVFCFFPPLPPSGVLSALLLPPTFSSSVVSAASVTSKAGCGDATLPKRVRWIFFGPPLGGHR